MKNGMGINLSANPVKLMARLFLRVWAWVFGHDIFISYARDDGRRIVEQIAPELERKYLVFIDMRAIHAGERFTERIEQALRRARFLTVILTEKAINSQWVQREAEFYREHHGKRSRVMPIFVPPVQVDTLPDQWEWISEFHGYSFTDGESALRHLVADIKQSFRGARQRMLAMWTAGIILISLLCVSWYAYFVDRVGESRRLAAMSLAEKDANLEKSLKLAIQSYETATIFESESALLATLQHRPALINIVREHSGSVSAIVFTNDGKLLVSAAHDRTIRIWDFVSNRPAGVLKGHVATINDLVIDPEGTTLVSTSDDESVLLWDLASRRMLGAIKHSAFVKGATISANGKFGATCDISGVIKIWEFASRRVVNTLHQGISKDTADRGVAVFDVAFDHLNATRLTSTGWGQVTLWNLADNPPQATRRSLEPSNQLWRVSYDPTRQRLAVSSESGNVHWYDSETLLQIEKSLKLHDSGIIGLGHSPNGEWLACGTSAGDVVLLALTEHVVAVDRRVLQRHSSLAGAIAFTQDSKILATGGKDGICLWDVDDFQILAEVLDRDSAGNTPIVATSHNESKVAVLLNDGITVWQIDSATRSLPPVKAPEGSVLDMAFLDGRIFVAIKGENGAVRLTSENRTWMLNEDHGKINQLTFNASGTVFLTSNDKSVIHLWETETGELKHDPIQLTAISSGSLAVSPDGQAVVAGSFPVTLWRFMGKEIRTMTWEWDIDSATFSRDGRFVALANDQQVAIINVSSGRQVATLEVHGRPPLVLDFSPDGNRLAGGGYDEEILIWDIQSEQLVGVPLRGHDHNQIQAIIRNVRFSADGKYLISTADDGRVLRWRVDPEYWVERAHNIVE